MGLCGSTPAAATVDLVGSTVGSSVGSTSAGSTNGEQGTVSAGAPPQANAVDPRQARADDDNRGRSHSTEPSAAQRAATAAALRDIGDDADAAASADAAEAAADGAESLAGGEADNDLGRARMKIYRKMVETERQCYWDLKNLCDIFYVPARNRQLLGKNLISSIFSECEVRGSSLRVVPH